MRDRTLSLLTLPDLLQEAGELALNGKPSYPSTAQPDRKRPRLPSDTTPPRRSGSRSRSRSRSRDRSGAFHHGDRHFSREDTRENNYGTIFVGNISHDTNENTLRDFFEAYGRVASAKVRPCMPCAVLVLIQLRLALQSSFAVSV